MKKKVKALSKVFDKEITFIIDDSIKPSPTTGDGFVARKLKEANEHLSKIKNLDEILKRYSSPE